ncbi:bifunctional DNA-formamidopyrimidine glycosylase/DNA-(apurinic or apyrimidinic site) lyase [Thermosulfuriphilus ammonigenes]|uniref:Formamidopyrimidine-DNA glycosylase n=1 Tax=Thermosulfuriphilus ammonigenes TaxID=1936021 RepID=A0A6G7PUL7_9BACT|nr:bifunctional DNA-formamidopyrimidine glycosylase/DNA-(apurinic or apyrimidinic site) lyase [Thermosulfuriphilus ammonigenes]MBA2848474.1 formamidopyrimidine-DNA glycosylase [Thermosulfuriphilus ammonigenes]QIJ71375.1 bifunctional DNA-formamidopyrimidine glycosylase/DNA-(apurinic or apyrimidinic site) lyase [Thermosulfuriphilus ammonigenes]
MPELPEVETVVRDLKPRLTGRRISGLKVLLPKLLRQKPAEFNRIIGHKILGLSRRGKLILIHLSGDLTLIVHLKLTGRLVHGKNQPDHTHVIFEFDNGSRLFYADLRQFGFLDLVPTSRLKTHQALASLGPEPFDISEEEFLSILSRSRRKIKALLLDQNLIAGLGNIYTDEALFRAGIHPERPANTLTAEEARRLLEAIRQVLKEAISARGSSVRNYVDGQGRAGSFQSRHQVYHQQGKPCPRCGTPIVRKIVAGRGTHFCPYCQPFKHPLPSLD